MKKLKKSRQTTTKYIRSSWNGVFSPKFIMDNSSISDESEACKLSEYLYQNGYDTGYSSMYDCLNEVLEGDFDDVYHLMTTGKRLTRRPQSTTSIGSISIYGQLTELDKLQCRRMIKFIDDQFPDLEILDLHFGHINGSRTNKDYTLTIRGRINGRITPINIHDIYDIESVYDDISSQI